MHHQLPINNTQPNPPSLASTTAKGVLRKYHPLQKITSDRADPTLVPPTTTTKSRHQKKVSTSNNPSPNHNNSYHPLTYHFPATMTINPLLNRPYGEINPNTGAKEIKELLPHLLHPCPHPYNTRIASLESREK